MLWVNLTEYKGKTKTFYQLLHANLYEKDWSTAPAIREKFVLTLTICLLAYNQWGPK
jgi:hypothetical protein